MMNRITVVVAAASNNEKTTNSSVLRQDMSLCRLSNARCASGTSASIQSRLYRTRDINSKLTIGGTAWRGHHPVRGRPVMVVEMLTYAALSERLGCSAEAARALVKRLRLPRQRGNNGKALVAVDVAELNHTPMTRTGTRRSPDDHHAVVAALKARIETLEAEVANSRAFRPVTGRTSSASAIGASGSWPRCSRRRRTAREAAARLAGELEAFQVRPWWRRLVG
jgi:hypothetical protein